MRTILWKAMTLAAIAAATACIGSAQANPASAPQPALLAASNPSSPAAADTTSHSTAVTPPAPSPLEQEVEILKARIDQLEKEVEHTAIAEGSSDAARLTAAEKELVAGNGSAVLSSVSPTAGTSSSLQAATPTAPAEPAAPKAPHLKAPKAAPAEPVTQ